MSVKRTWIIAVIAVDLVIVTFIAGYIMLDRLDGEMTQVSPAASTTTPEATSPGPVRGLPDFDGSVLLGGSVSSEIRTADTTWVTDDEGWSSLAINDTPVYDLADSVCLDTACSVELDQLVDGGRFIWITEGAAGFSDELSHAIAPSGESLAACWSLEHDGPVVAILGSDASVIDRAWVLSDANGATTWFGLDPATIGRNDVLPLPFAGYDLPTC